MSGKMGPEYVEVTAYPPAMLWLNVATSQPTPSASQPVGLAFGRK